MQGDRWVHSWKAEWRAERRRRRRRRHGAFKGPIACARVVFTMSAFAAASAMAQRRLLLTAQSPRLACAALLRPAPRPAQWSRGQHAAAVAAGPRRQPPLPPPGEAARRTDALFRRQAPLLTLERAVGEKHGVDANLWDSCRFAAQIYPDLPLASTWRDLLRRTVQTAGRPAEPGGVEPPPAVCPAERWTVRTVAAQLRSRDQLRSMMLSAAGVGPDGEPRPGVAPADALLFVSGSHPARRLPGAGRWAKLAGRCRLLVCSDAGRRGASGSLRRHCLLASCSTPCNTPSAAPTPPCLAAREPRPLPRRWLQSSFDLLLLASAMREEGYLPATLSLWAVENPMLAPVERLQQKADAGAEVVLTQPPLLWERTAAWAEAAATARVSEHVKVGGEGVGWGVHCEQACPLGPGWGG